MTSTTLRAISSSISPSTSSPPPQPIGTLTQGRRPTIGHAQAPSAGQIADAAAATPQRPARSEDADTPERVGLLSRNNEEQSTPQQRPLLLAQIDSVNYTAVMPPGANLTGFEYEGTF